MTISRWLHYLFFADSSESLCSRAYRLRHGSEFWAAWVRMFGEALQGIVFVLLEAQDMKPNAATVAD
jgi:hypothetical protein